jgi:HEAT repeat protein
MTTCLLFVSLLSAQQELPAGHTSTRPELPQPRPMNSDPVVESSRDRMKQARDLGKQGSEAIPQLVKLYDDANIPVRVEVIHSIAEIGGPRSLDPLVKALADPDAEIQIRATDGELLPAGLHQDRALGEAEARRFGVAGALHGERNHRHRARLRAGS